jgi:C4-dicarboxylate-specific signal transduction histidine kinase
VFSGVAVSDVRAPQKLSEHFANLSAWKVRCKYGSPSMKNTLRFWRVFAHCLLGGLGIALLTFVCFRLQVGVTVVAFFYLIMVLLASIVGGFVPSVLVSISAVLCLDYFFTKPIFSLRMEEPVDIVFVIALLTTASTISVLMVQRKRAEDSLRESEQRRRAEAAEQALNEARLELARVTRVTTLGELMASISHEINQPLAGVVTNGQACLRWLSRDPPELDEVRSSVERVVRDGNRASDLIQRVRALAKKVDPEKISLNINEVIQEALLLVQSEVHSRGVDMRTNLGSTLPQVMGDRVQLQQVFINLIMNGVEAMAPLADRPREMVVESRQDGAANVVVSVRDSGVGIAPNNAEQVFRAFFTTKSGGMGMGLSISRSIINSHGGRLWLSPNIDHGATFYFALPVSSDGARR